MGEIYNIASLPYKQQRFGSLRVEAEDDHVDLSSRPYSLTAKQKNTIKEPTPQTNYFPASEPNTNTSVDSEEEIRRKTFIE